MHPSTQHLIVVGPVEAPAAARAGRVAHLLLIGLAAVLAAAIGLGIVVGPRLLPYRVLYVRTGSMAPSLPVGSLVVVTQAPAGDVQVNDVVTFVHPDGGERLVTHRVVAREPAADGDAFVTKGDANAEVDPWRIPAAGTGWRVAFSVPLAGFVLGHLQSAALGTWAFAAVVLMFAARTLVGIWRPQPALRSLRV